jgi:hypothetical protein
MIAMPQHLIALEGKSGFPVRVNPDLIIMVDRAMALNQQTGAVTMLPGLLTLNGINTQFMVKGTIDGAKGIFDDYMVFEQKDDAHPGEVLVNPRWISGVQQNIDIKGGNTPIVGKAVLSTPLTNIVVDGNYGEIAARVESWWTSHTPMSLET